MRTLLVFALVPALLAAGCVDAPEDVEAAAATDAGLATPGEVAETPFTWDGAFAPGAVACPLVMCTGVQGQGVYSDLSLTGTLTAVALEMTWDATTPNTESLRFGIAWGDDGFEYVEGPSPLVLDVADLDIDASDDPYVWAWVPTVVPMGFATALTPQDFHVEGTLTETAQPRSVEP